MTQLCPICKLPEMLGHECLPTQQKAMEALLLNAGDAAACSGCGARIFWVRHRNGKPTPYDPNGLNHFISCPKAENFRRAR